MSTETMWAKIADKTDDGYRIIEYRFGETIYRVQSIRKVNRKTANFWVFKGYTKLSMRFTTRKDAMDYAEHRAHREGLR